MVKLGECGYSNTQNWGVRRDFKNNYYISAILGIIHPILNEIRALGNRPEGSSSSLEKRKIRVHDVIVCLSGTAFLATALFGILQAAAVHWGLIASITALLSGVGISIGSAGVVPLIMGVFLLVGVLCAGFENHQREKRWLDEVVLAKSREATQRLVSHEGNRF